jgi:rRNA small subunit pseudouridine methyltransferase Nep1
LLTLILAETALETIPKKIHSHFSIRNYSKRKIKPLKRLLLERSIHHSAMQKLNNNKKRGRPDIAHMVLLQALNSPLNKEGYLKIYVHTNNDFVITVNPITRIPRNYNQFIGLMEQLFSIYRVPPEGEILLELERKTLQELLFEIKVDYVLLFSTEGKLKTIKEAICNIPPKSKPVIIIGGFPQGSFSKETLKLVDEIVCVDSKVLDALTITSRAIYEYEISIKLPEKRVLNS